jgi:hypothetical protein
MNITPDDRFYKTWIEDLGWVVDYAYAIPRITKKGYTGCKWKCGKKIKFNNKEDADLHYQEIKSQLEAEYALKQIALYRISKTHVTKTKTACPKCGKPADVFDFMLMMGTDIYPSCPIVCEHCAKNKDTWFDNTVGEYFYKDDSEFGKRDDEEYFYRDKYIITIDDLKKKGQTNEK